MNLITFWWFAVVGIATMVTQATKMLYAGPFSTGMRDRIAVQLPVWEIYLGLTNHPGQLSLVILP